jgi:hypothetical protein
LVTRASNRASPFPLLQAFSPFLTHSHKTCITALMESHLASLRPSLFPSRSSSGLVSSSPRSQSHAFDHGPLPLSPYPDDNSRKRRSLQETWVAPSPSQSPRIPASPLPSPSPAPHHPPLSGRSWNEAKRRKLAQESKQVSPSHSFSDTLASSALSLASLSLSIYPNFTPTNLESPSFYPFPPTQRPEKVSSMSLSTSLIASPGCSPLSASSSNSDSPLSSSCKVGSSVPQSPSSTPPSSPSHPQMKIEIRHKGKQLKSRCTCCHVCRTSLKNYPRPHLDCTACNAVVCQPCIEFRYP